MLQLVLMILIYLIMVIPVGSYLYHIAAGKHTFADPVLNRVDDVIYKISGIDPHKKMDWKKYALALLGTNAVMILLGYMILRIQSIPIFNPNGIGVMEESLSFNTIISFMTNTNLQHYSGESGLSYLGLGIVPPAPSLGKMISDAQSYLYSNASYLIYPAALLVVLILAINVMGDSLRDILDPRLNRE